MNNRVYNQIKHKLTDLCLYSSVQGLPRLLRTDNKLIKLIWFISLCMSPCVLVFYITRIIADYFKTNADIIVDFNDNLLLEKL